MMTHDHRDGVDKQRNLQDVQMHPKIHGEYNGFSAFIGTSIKISSRSTGRVWIGARAALWYSSSFRTQLHLTEMALNIWSRHVEREVTSCAIVGGSALIGKFERRMVEGSRVIQGTVSSR